MIRIVHLSDLHVSIDAVDNKPPFFSGLEGVEVDSYFSLAESARLPEMARRPLQPEATYCIVSGDLSASGRENELRDSFNYIESKIFFSTAIPTVGLEYDKRQYHAVLGNHDIWGGKSPLLAWHQSEKKENKGIPHCLATVPSIMRIC